MRFVDALIKAKKDFDLLVIPAAVTAWAAPTASAEWRTSSSAPAWRRTARPQRGNHGMMERKDGRNMRFFLAILTLCVGTTLADAANSDVPWPVSVQNPPHQTNRLTAADVVGPTGSSIPTGPVAASRVGFRTSPWWRESRTSAPSPTTISTTREALHKACEAAGRTGGAVAIGEGTYYLDRPVTIRHDNVVIRGQGHRELAWCSLCSPGARRRVLPPSCQRRGRRIRGSRCTPDPPAWSR